MILLLWNVPDSSLIPSSFSQRFLTSSVTAESVSVFISFPFSAFFTVSNPALLSITTVAPFSFSLSALHNLSSLSSESLNGSFIRLSLSLDTSNFVPPSPSKERDSGGFGGF